jgi:hypothetical protein
MASPFTTKHLVDLCKKFLAMSGAAELVLKPVLERVS